MSTRISVTSRSIENTLKYSFKNYDIDSRNQSGEIVNDVFALFESAIMQVRDTNVETLEFCSRDGRPRYFDAECNAAKRTKRLLERKLRSCPSTYNDANYEAHLFKYYDLLTKKRNEYFAINLSSISVRTKFTTLKSLLKHTPETLPKHEFPEKNC